MVSQRYSTYLIKLESLANGEITPKSVSEWAEGEQLSLDQKGEKLSFEEEELLSTLQIADALNEKGGNLYKRDDFRSWLKEYEAKPYSR